MSIIGILLVFFKSKLKLRRAIIILSTFIAIMITINLSFYSYAREAPVVKTMILKPSFHIMQSPYSEYLVKIDIAAVKIGKSTIISIITDNATRLADIWGIKVSGRYPNGGEAIIGKSLKDLRAEVSIGEESYKIVGIIENEEFRWTIIAEGLPRGQYYISRGNASNLTLINSYPSAILVLEKASEEIAGIIEVLTSLMIILFIITSGALGYIIGNDLIKIFNTIKIMNEGRRFIISSTIALITVMSGIVILLGFSISVIALGIISALISVFLNFPYISIDFSTSIFPMILQIIGFLFSTLLIGTYLGLRGS